MEIINDEEKITNEYKIYCENIKEKKEQIILEINKLLVSKNNICKTFDIISLCFSPNLTSHFY